MLGDPIGLTSHRWRNNNRTILLLCLYPILILGVSWITILIGSILFKNYRYKVMNGESLSAAMSITNTLFLDYAPIVVTAVIIWFIIAWFLQGKMIREMSGAKAVSRGKEPVLYNLLENLCIAQGITMPRLQIIETHARNAFASGLSDRDYCITVTRGLMRSLTKDEMEAVLAHELAHIQNRDVRLLVTSIILCGLFGFIAQLCWVTLRRGMIFRGRNKNKGQFIILFLVFTVIISIAYFFTMWTRFALSRTREYDADAMAVEMTKRPEALMRALMRISDRAQIPTVTDDISMMCIENAKPFLGLFRTHPPISERIRILSKLTHTPIPEKDKDFAPAPKEQRVDPSDPAEITKENNMQKRHYAIKKRHNPWLRERYK